MAGDPHSSRSSESCMRPSIIREALLTLPKSAEERLVLADERVTVKSAFRVMGHMAAHNTVGFTQHEGNASSGRKRFEWSTAPVLPWTWQRGRARVPPRCLHAPIRQGFAKHMVVYHRERRGTHRSPIHPLPMGLWGSTVRIVAARIGPNSVVQLVQQVRRRVHGRPVRQRNEALPTGDSKGDGNRPRDSARLRSEPQALRLCHPSTKATQRASFCAAPGA